jgi:aryl-alcohol dehydrogenase-like predicted oxidoreductase
MTHAARDTDTLPTAPLGTTGMRITRVGFGAWAIGGGGWTFAWGNQDDADSIAAIRHAIERGINWIDTAAVYGLGHSEEIVARALRDIPADDRPYVFTKAGLVWDDHNRAAAPRRIGDPLSLRREVEASLRRLDVERIDLYQMHWPAEDGTLLEDYWGTLLQLKAEGKVRAVGLSNHDVAQLQAAERLGHVDTLQPPFSAIRREVAAAELPWCAAHRTGVIVYSPMQSGLLTGAFSLERAAQLGADDWRSRSVDFTGLGLRRNVALADALRPIAERHGATVAAVAVAWTLAWPGVTGAIVGARSPDQVDGWIGAASLELTETDLDDVSVAIGRTGAGTGPVRR